MGTYKGPIPPPPPEAGAAEWQGAMNRGTGAGVAGTSSETASNYTNESNNTLSEQKVQMRSNFSDRDRTDARGNPTASPEQKIQMRSNFSGRDRAFSDFSYPSQTHSNDTPTPTSQASPSPAGRPLVPQATGSNNPFLAATYSDTNHRHTVSSTSDFEPIADLSSFDASTTRAMPGYRGAHGTILDGWAEEGEDSGVIPKTWEEEQERRRKAEQELLRRKELAEREEMERRLGEEFWRGEEERFGPVVPEKIRPHSTGGVAPVPVPGAAPGWLESTQEMHIPSSAPVGPNYYGGAPPPPPIAPQQVQQQVQQQQEPQQDLFLPQDEVRRESNAPKAQEPPKSPNKLPATTEENTSTQPETTPASPAPARNPSPEAYQIKHITWVDPVTSQTRRSPILLQNENGPCPLLALVNALTLSTPSSSTTILTETLRVREHVSLGLLLDAVFDGVVNRAASQGVDVDMSDLFAFLMSLSTGMNVNPRFVFPTTPSGEDGPPQLLGSFEQTREMRLYNSFGVPLYHGWLPTPCTTVTKVLQRAAPTYEEVQNLLLHEEIILHRISTATQGSPDADITRQEENVVEDAGIIRTWLDESCTQLTDWGLDSLTAYWGGDITDGKGTGLGKMGILFRNDHFCTVMKARLPGRPGEVLLSLVTDMGYGGYEEVVWESLVSINGQGGEFLAGDYRPVGGSGNDGGGGRHGMGHVRSSMVDVDDDEGWETVEGSHRRRGGGRQNHQQRYHPQPQQQQYPLPHQHHAQQQQQKQANPSQRRSFVDALLGRGSSQAQAALWHQPSGPQPPRGTVPPSSSSIPPPSSTHPNALPNSQIPPPMLPPRSSSLITDPLNSSTNTNPPTGPPLDLSSLRVAIAEPQPGDEPNTDYDLALALQLQEEEDERERQRLERQRRGQSLQSPPMPQIPSTPRTSTTSTPASPRNPLPQQQQAAPAGRMAPEEQPRNNDGSVRDIPPPPYEQHAQDVRHPAPQFSPPPHNPSSPELARYNTVNSRRGQPISGIHTNPVYSYPQQQHPQHGTDAAFDPYFRNGRPPWDSGFPGQQGGMGVPGQPPPQQQAGGRRGSGGGFNNWGSSSKEGKQQSGGPGGGKDCVIM